LFFPKAKFFQSPANLLNSLRKYSKLQEIHDFFLLPVDFDEEYLFLIPQYLFRESDGGDGRGCVRENVRESEHDRHGDVRENECVHRDDGECGGFLPFWLR